MNVILTPRQTYLACIKCIEKNILSTYCTYFLHIFHAHCALVSCSVQRKSILSSFVYLPLVFSLMLEWYTDFLSSIAQGKDQKVDLFHPVAARRECSETGTTCTTWGLQ